MITKKHEAPGHGGGTGSPMIFEAEAPLRMQANVKATIFGHMLARASSAAWHNVQTKKSLQQTALPYSSRRSK